MSEPITINALLQLGGAGEKQMVRQGDITGFDDAEVLDVETEEEEKKDSTE